MQKIISYLKRKIRKIILGKFYTEIWNIGFTNALPEDTLKNNFNQKNINWIPKRESYKYYADPFFIKENNQILLFCEGFDYRTKMGDISLIKLDEKFQQISEKQILNPNSHLSYPVLIKHQDRLLMMPENSAAGELNLYKPTSFPENWEKEKLLLKEKAIDATLLEHDNKFWLFYSLRSKNHPKNSELYISFSDDFFGEFKPHPQNPVKIDKSSARPAGNFFKIADKIYRPSQDCSVGYGDAVVINEIVTLTEKEYSERQINKIIPNKSWPYPDGIHTINFQDDICVIDAKKLTFTPWKFLIKWQRKLLNK